MDASLVSFASSPVATPSGGLDAPAAAADSGIRGADFAQLFSQMMAATQRQGLAAGPASLQALSLSPNIEVITADAPLPDSDSLLAFARSQGLDEGMIGALFVPAPGAEPSAAALTLPWSAAQAASAAGAAGSDRTQTAPVQPDLAAPATELPGLAVQVLVPPAVLSAAQALSGPASPAAAPAAISVQAVPAAVLVQAAPPARDPLLTPDLGEPAEGKAPAPSAASLAALGGPALRRMDLQWSASASAAALVATAPVEAGVRAQALASAGAAPMQNVLRVRLQPQEAITRRLADLAASGQQAVWADLSGPVAAEPDFLRLDLADLPLAVDELASDATPAPMPLPAHLAGRHSAQANLPQPTPEPVALPDRAAQYEQLAQRLGQALGQRLQAQIESGQWKVQMQVDPASLGRIDMELDMRAGGLDAVFRSDNALTRELITQGLPRLRESLAQSGTAVASVWVQGDSGRQSGGNSTPGRWQAPNRGQVGKEEEVSTEPSAVAARPTSNNAWDLLA